MALEVGGGEEKRPDFPRFQWLNGKQVAEAWFRQLGKRRQRFRFGHSCPLRPDTHFAPRFFRLGAMYGGRSKPSQSLARALFSVKMADAKISDGAQKVGGAQR
jgi:hypothetical protein